MRPRLWLALPLLVVLVAAASDAMPYVQFTAYGTATSEDPPLALDVIVEWRFGVYRVLLDEANTGVGVLLTTVPGELLMTDWLFFEDERCAPDPLASSAHFRGYDRQTEGRIVGFEGPLFWCWQDISMDGGMQGRYLDTFDLHLTRFQYE